MGKKSPRRGSLAYWHRARAKRLVPRIRSWNALAESGVAGFAGYKAGMQSLLMVDDSTAPTQGQQVVVPATVIEAPPLFVYAIVAYKQTPVGLKASAQINAVNAPKQLKRSLTIAKKAKDPQLNASDFAEIRVLACSQPWKSGFGKKTPELIEFALSGSPEKQLEYAKSILGKELRAQDVFKAGEYVDAIAVTRGHGWQGVVKRMGVSLNTIKATGARRHGGSIGAERQAKVMYTIPRAGQHGFHQRTDENKRVLLVEDSSKAGKSFHHYGSIKTDFILVKGSVPGPAKRFIALRKSIHPRQVKAPAILSQ